MRSINKDMCKNCKFNSKRGCLKLGQKTSWARRNNQKHFFIENSIYPLKCIEEILVMCDNSGGKVEPYDFIREEYFKV